MSESLKGHYKRVIKRDSPFLGAWDLHDVNGKPFSAVVKIERIEECEVVDSEDEQNEVGASDRVRGQSEKASLQVWRDRCVDRSDARPDHAGLDR